MRSGKPTRHWSSFLNGWGADLCFKRHVHTTANSDVHKISLTVKVNGHNSQVNRVLQCRSWVKCKSKICIKNSSVSFKGDMNSFPIFLIPVDGSVALMGGIPSWWSSNSSARGQMWYVEVSSESKHLISAYFLKFSGLNQEDNHVHMIMMSKLLQLLFNYPFSSIASISVL